MRGDHRMMIVRACAIKPGNDSAADLLSRTLEEEKEADETLNGIAEELNLEISEGQNVTQKRASRTSRRAA